MHPADAFVPSLSYAVYFSESGVFFAYGTEWNKICPVILEQY